MKKMKYLYLLALTVVFISCKKEDDSTNPSDNNNQISSSDYMIYFSGKIDGKSFNIEKKFNDLNSGYAIVQSGGLTVPCAYDAVNAGINRGKGLYPNDENSNLPGMELIFVKFILCSELKDKQQYEIFNDKFPVGDYKIATDDDEYSGTASTIAFTYSPNVSSSLYYTTNGDQTGSYAKITKSTPENKGKFFYSQIIEGEFSAKLYNQKDSLDIMTITEGSFKVVPHIIL